MKMISFNYKDKTKRGRTFLLNPHFIVEVVQHPEDFKKSIIIVTSGNEYIIDKPIKEIEMSINEAVK
jgi:uncharacterized protein YlzI (FlbEa/FlbD family)